MDNQVDKNLPEVENEAEPEEAPEVDIEQLQAENQKLREDYLRAFAEAENTKRRCAQEIEKKQQIRHFLFWQKSAQRCRQPPPRH
ncbi:MAG: nucleotide exchange factor GrpE [Alphaproteobacteria bacterium]